MSLTLHYGSGSPYAWKIWLALEHKQLPYDFKLLSFDRGDTRTPEYLHLNPRAKVPTLVDGDLALRESSAILEYLEERYPERPLLPATPEARARVRRLAAEADHYLGEVQHDLHAVTLYTKPAERDPAKISAAIDAVIAELERLAADLRGDWFGGDSLSVADLAIYPFLRLLRRTEDRIPELGLLTRFSPAITDYMARFAKLPYLEKTTPPHWR